MSVSSPVHRPIGVTILAILAGIVAVLAAIHALQALAILPYIIGPVSVRDFNFWYFLMWALMVWVYIWVFQMLWNVNPSGWMFLVIITVFNLCFDFISLIGSTTVSDVSVSLILNVIVLAYCMLPGVRRAFIPNS